MISIETLRGRIGLTLSQVAGTIELAAMPLWVGMLMQAYGMDPQQAGSLVTLYVAGAVVGGGVAARAFGKLLWPGRLIAVGGAFVGSAVFFAISQVQGYVLLAVLHVVGGLFVGPVIAVTAGTIARSVNPHRLFAICNLAFSLFAALFLGVVPLVVARNGGQVLFLVISAVLLLGAVGSALAFPHSLPRVPTGGSRTTIHEPVPKEVWIGMAGLCLMASMYAMTLSFFERVGMARGYGAALVGTVLTITAVIKLFPAAIAGLLEKRLSAKGVMLVMPLVQAVTIGLIFAVPSFWVYAVAGPLFIGTLLFTHIFAFGLLSRIEPTGRAMAAEPSLMLLGAGLGPLIGGTLVKMSGYPSLAIAGGVLAAVATLCFLRVPNEPAGPNAASTVPSDLPAVTVDAARA